MQKPRNPHPVLGPVVFFLVAGAVLLSGLLVNGCRLNKLLARSGGEDGALVVTPPEVKDSALAGTTTSRVANIDVRNAGKWSATPDADWIHVSPTSGGSSTRVRLALDPRGLSAGIHEGLVLVKERSGAGDSVPVTVSFLILQPILGVDPHGFTFTARSGNAVFSDTLRVTNDGTGPLTWSARLARNGSWIQLGDTAGTGVGAIPIRVSNEGLPFFASVRDTIIVEAPGAKNSPARVPVQLKRKT